MATQAPPIDRRTYPDLVAELEALVEQETTVQVEPRAELLEGVYLAQDVYDPGDPSAPIATRDTLVDAALAAQIEALASESVDVVLWRSWTPVEPTAENLTGTVLGEDLYQPGSDPPHLVASWGTEVDASLAAKIEALSGLERVKVARSVDAVGSLARIGARLGALVIDRLNQVPEKGFLAFLDLIGAEPAPPQPARVPLTFHLAARSPVDVLVPAGTQVAAPPAEGEKEPVVFETELDLVVGRLRLVAAFVREGGRDLYRQVTDFVQGEAEAPFQAFRGEDPIAHRIYVGHRRLLGIPGQKTVCLKLEPPAGSSGSWPWPTAWSYWDGMKWTLLAEAADDGHGQVTLVEVPAVPTREMEGEESAWLRGELDLSRTEAPSDWTLTRLDTVRLGIEIADSDLLPELAFANQVPIDPSTDFFPFGERPKVGDVFYLANDAAFSRPGAAVTLEVELTETPFASQDPALELAWEYWNGKQWTVLEGLSAKGGENGDASGPSVLKLIENGTISFEGPQKVSPVDVQGETRHWLRVRLVQGNYGVEAGYREAGRLTLDPDSHGNAVVVPYYQLTEATLRPPSIRSLKIGYVYQEEDEEPEHVLTENDFVFLDETEAARSDSQPFQPFSPSRDLRPSLYLGFEGPDEKTGFGNRSVALFLAVAESFYDPSRASVSSDPVVVWEYWNGERFKLLDARDETRGLTRRGLVSFVGPSDFCSRSDFGRQAFWLRVRWESGDYAVAPEIEWISTATTWACHQRTLEKEVLGGSSGERNQLFTTAQAPVLSGQTLEVREPERPSADELAALEAEVGAEAVETVLDAGGQPVEVWVRWHQVPDFYASGSRSRHYTLDRLSGEIRFGDGRRGLVPPSGRGNVRMARYRTGGGLAGNLPAKTLVQLKGTVPYVDGVVNQVPATGGGANESAAQVQRRAPRSLRHRGRAVAGDDFEDLALQASGQVARARAIISQERADAGRVGLIVVPRSEEAKPIPSLELLRQVEEYVSARATPTLSLWVAGPTWVQVTVEAEIVPRQPEAATEVRGAARQRLEAFLHPLTGGPDNEGWPFSRKPERSDLLAVLAATPGVDHVRRMDSREMPDGGELLADRFLIYSGDHRITLAGGDPAPAPSG